jgi:hypothetical protein
LAIGNRKSAGSFFGSFTRAGLKRASLFSLPQLSACATALQRTLIRTQTCPPINRQDTLNFSVGARNNVNANQFAHSARGGGPGVRCRFDRANVSANKYCHVASPDILFPQQLNIRSLDHCVGGFDRANEAFGLHHSECF